MMKRRGIVWVVLVLSIIALCACSSGSSGGSESTVNKAKSLTDGNTSSSSGVNGMLVARAGDPMVVKATPDGQGGLLAAIDLDGSNSYDLQGLPLKKYTWRLVSCEAEKAALATGTILNPQTLHNPAVSVSVNAVGTYTFGLTVDNGVSQSSQDTVVVLVNLDGPPPLVNPVLKDKLSDYRIVDQYGKCYLAQSRSYAPAPGDQSYNFKQILYLEGDAYTRGYAEGYLCPHAAWRMTHEFVYNYLKGLLGLPLQQLPDALLEQVRQIFIRVSLSQEYAVPLEFRNEMQGIADGCQSRGVNVTYNDVFMLNVAFDLLYSLIYQAGSLACNEISIFGDGTLDGRLYHGRDFMFSTGGGVFSDESMIIAYKPTEGYPFLAASVPGFVGFPTGMNSRGVSMGMDMVPNRQNRALITGMGVLLNCRNVTQYAGSLQEGIEKIKNTHHAVSWLYQLSDGATFEETAHGLQQKSTAVALETVSDGFLAEGEDIIATLGDLIPGLDTIFSAVDSILQVQIVDNLGHIITGAEDLVTGLIDLFPQLAYLTPDRGVAVRPADYVDPAGIEQYRIVISGDDLIANGTQESTIVSLFPLQREDKDGLVAMSNHYILPQMNLTQMGLFYHTIDTAMGGGRESEWRYNTMLNPLLDDDDLAGDGDGYAVYGMIDAGTAMFIIDFLNPGYGSRGGGFYGTSPDHEVEGHHILMDDASLQMWALHGYFDEPWMHVDLRWFL